MTNKNQIISYLFNDTTTMYSYISLVSIMFMGLIFYYLYNEIACADQNKKKYGIFHYIVYFLAAIMFGFLCVRFFKDITGLSLSTWMMVLIGFGVYWMGDYFYFNVNKIRERDNKFSQGGIIGDKLPSKQNNKSFEHCPNCGAPVKDNKCHYCSSHK